MRSVWFWRGFARLLKFLQIKEGDQISGGDQFCRNSELFCPRFCICISKLLVTQILCNLLDIDAFCMIQKDFGETSEISRN